MSPSDELARGSVSAMQPETVISLAALYVAVVSLAHSLGGTFGAAGATVLGVAMVAVVATTAARGGLSGLSRLIVWAVNL